jgi:hypothetical protein
MGEENLLVGERKYIIASCLCSLRRGEKEENPIQIYAYVLSRFPSKRIAEIQSLV